MRHSFFAFATAALCAGAPVAAEARDVMVVLDASGSMWGQIDGVTKIEIARDVFADVSRDWDAEGVSVGLIAYGHRRKGDCSDIELLAPVAPGSAARLDAVVNGVVPRGKTPLSDAVRMAADEMKFTEEAATVILLTDGKETCNADPCALGAELERLGVDFTTHVIGFDISDPSDKAPLQCLAAATGGRYLDSGDAGALGDALRQMTEAAEPTSDALPSHGLQLGLSYAEGTVRPQAVRFQARNPETGEIRDLGQLTGTEQVITGLTTDLEQGTWVIDALSDEGQGTIEIAHTAAQQVLVPFAARPVKATIQDGSPYQLGTPILVMLDLSGAQEGAEIPVTLFAPDGTRIDWETRFGSEGDGLSVHDLASPETAGVYRIVVGDPADPLAVRELRFDTDVAPEWRGARQGPLGGTIPTHLSGNTYYYNRLILSQGGTEVLSQQLGYEGAPLQLPQQAGVYDLSYLYDDISGTAQTADLGQITVGAGGAAALPDDADAVAPPAGVDTAPAGDTQAMDAGAHGWEPSSPAASADAALLRDADAEDVVFRCHEELCHYDDPETGATGIPIHGDFALLRPVALRDGRLLIEMVNEHNGEWVVLNPIRQSDMVTDCASFGVVGWHSASEGGETDMACTVKGATGTTFTQMETLAIWASDRNAAAHEAERAAHDATMGEEAPGAPAGHFQDNWIATDLQTGAELMRWQVMQDAGAPEAYLDVSGQPGTVFEGLSGRMGDTPSITLVGDTPQHGPAAFQINKPLAQGTLAGLFTRPSDWDGSQDSYTGMLQVSGGAQPVSAQVLLTRAAGAPATPDVDKLLEALSGGPETLLSEDAQSLMNSLSQVEGMDQLLQGEGGAADLMEMLSDPEALGQMIELGKQLDKAGH